MNPRTDGLRAAASVLRTASTPRVRTVFLGSGGFGLDALRRLAAHPDVDLVGVVTAPPRPAGRKQQLKNTVIDDQATQLGMPTILRPERLRAAEAVADVFALRPQLLVLADYGQIVPGTLLDLEHGALNLHPSLLPRHRGATPIPAAILAGDTETGVTLMRMDEGLDTGPIVAQRRVALDGSETTPGLEEALTTVAGDLLEESLAPWIGGELTPAAQPDAGGTMTAPLTREDGRMDPRKRADVLEREVRAFMPWPGSFVDTAEGRLGVLSASVGSVADRPPGVFGPVGLAAADRELRLIEVRPAGGNAMPWEAYLRGHPRIIGTTALASEA
ncbi:MAG: methionyl-tRNA formyltransferase [Chloroflexota bacterium]